jgi:hypothetical protein
MREYVTGCLSFMQYMKDMVEGMLRTLPKNRSLFDTDLTCLIYNIGEKMDKQSHVTLALEHLQDARWNGGNALGWRIERRRAARLPGL